MILCHFFYALKILGLSENEATPHSKVMENVLAEKRVQIRNALKIFSGLTQKSLGVGDWPGVNFSPVKSWGQANNPSGRQPQPQKVPQKFIGILSRPQPLNVVFF